MTRGRFLPPVKVIDRSPDDGSGASSMTRGADRASGTRGEVQLELLEFARPADEDGGEGGRAERRSRPVELDVREVA